MLGIDVGREVEEGDHAKCLSDFVGLELGWLVGRGLATIPGESRQDSGRQLGTRDRAAHHRAHEPTFRSWFCRFAPGLLGIKAQTHSPLLAVGERPD